MDRSHFHESALYRAANGAVLAGIGLFMPFFGIGAVTWKNILVLSAVLAFLVGISFLPAREKGLCLLLAAVCLGVSVAVIGLHTSYEFLQGYVGWCRGYVGEQEQWMEGFRLLQTAVITAAAFLIQILLEKIRFLKNVLAFICADGLLFCLLAQISLTHMCVVLVLLFIVTVSVEWLQEHWKKRHSGDLKARMVWLAPFLCAYLLLMALMPAPETPYEWKWVKNVYNHVRESVLTLSFGLFHGGQEDFSTSLSGFSDRGGLGEGVHEDDREVMHIQAQGSLVSNLYLIGKVYDTFDGRQWLQEYRGDEKERFIDTLETLYAVRKQDGKYQTDYLRAADLKIRYEKFNTEYIFAPLKTGSLRGSGADLTYSFQGGDLVFEKRKGFGTEYELKYYQINMGAELFQQLLEAPLDLDKEFWRTVSLEITPELLDAHRQMIYENYLDPVTLSEEVESYLAEITRDAETDLEKLWAIEKELNTYTYTKLPGNLPEGVTDAGTFLDHFLLESRQGYCTYFATAFVLLARAEGFPARYVQGFCVPMKDSKEAMVSSNMAHAWPEVYLKGVGWIPFEPTPGYDKLRYTPWGVKVRDSASSYEAEGDAAGTGSQLPGPGEEKETKEEEEGPDEDPESARGSRFARLWRALMVGLLTAFAGFVLVLFFYNLVDGYRYRRMDLSEKFKVEVRRNLRVLSWIGLRREEQETLQELHDRGMLIPGLTALCFLKDYEDVLYGGKTAGEDLLEGVKKEREQLWIFLKKEKKRAYVLYRIRMFLVRER